MCVGFGAEYHVVTNWPMAITCLAEADSVQDRDPIGHMALYLLLQFTARPPEAVRPEVGAQVTFGVTYERHICSRHR